MTRGEDTSRHPGRQVGRLAHLISAQNNRAQRNHGLYPADGMDTTPEEMQEDLELYRNDRDTLGADDSEVKRLGKAYGDAFKNRHNDNYATPMYYPFTGVTE